ncbi:ankyrin repeat domain-containing protein 44 [Arthroderma uncinatum]|uniref:ankyrin repeat domain-containing protein 44 n=1 Tax=Arthroderma uncinatum TaxID=74035 RepID=UPI00144ADE12|nr:ankyrin repeat domain-containing protein 44 [Arthroderma uncinatum]KAF3481748.1 ankyrin repeat domain-containing protein 44 [Arthroderma uncinatum]
MDSDEVTWAPSDDPSYTAFFKAARHGTVEQLRAAFTSDIDVNALEGDGFEGMSALHLACFYNGDLEVVKFLLDHGAEVNILDRDRAGNSYPLHWAANKDRADIVKLLLDRGAVRDRKGFDGRNALGMVLYYSLSPRKVEAKQMETIKVLLDYGFSVDESGMYLIKFLLDHGGSINPANPKDPSLLGHAAGFTDYKTVKFLLDNGAVLDNPTDDSPSSVLVSAASTGNLSVVQLLLDRADPEIVRKSSRAISAAAASGHLKVVEMLLASNMRLDNDNAIGYQSPLHAACFTNQPSPELVTFLLSQGADVNSLDDRLNTPLHLHVSTFQPDEKVVKLLLDAGADLGARNTNGETPLLRASSALHCHYEQGNPHDSRGSAFVVLLRRLLKAGSDITAVDHSNQTALHILAANSPRCTPGECPERAAQVLLDMGVEVEALDIKGRTAIDILQEKHTIESRLILHTIENFKLRQSSK